MPHYKSWNVIPYSFSGECYVVDIAAIVRFSFIDGTRMIHCLDQPAIVRDDGLKEWYQHGKMHRLDGPAWYGAGYFPRYYINGENIGISKYWKHPMVIKNTIKNILNLLTE